MSTTDTDWAVATDKTATEQERGEAAIRWYQARLDDPRYNGYTKKALKGWIEEIQRELAQSSGPRAEAS